jgi:hypothetical protein
MSCLVRTCLDIADSRRPSRLLAQYQWRMWPWPLPDDLSTEDKKTCGPLMSGWWPWRTLLSSGPGPSPLNPGRYSFPLHQHLLWHHPLSNLGHQLPLVNSSLMPTSRAQALWAATCAWQLFPNAAILSTDVCSATLPQLWYRDPYKILTVYFSPQDIAKESHDSVPFFLWVCFTWSVDKRILHLLSP